MLESIINRGKPVITVPEAPVAELVIIDDIVGTGNEVPVGGHVTVHYVGVGQATGRQFDASWDRNEEISFGLNQVIAGWRDGLVGMREGGRRTLHIPGEQAYGKNPPPGSGIKSNETLVFVVDLIATR